MTEHEKLSIVANKGLEWKEKYKAAQAELESDRTKCAAFVTALDKALDARFWLTEGRGSYSWDDDRYRQEFKEAAEEILKVVMPMRSMAANKAQCPQTTAEVVKARVDLNATLARFRYAMRQAIENAGGIAEVAVSDEFLLMAVPAEMGALKHAKAKLERENATLREFRDGIRELFPDELAKYPEFVGNALTEEDHGPETIPL